APCGAPFLDAFWSGRPAAAAGAAGRAPAVGRSLGGFGGRGGWTRGQLACAFEAVRHPGDRLERAVEEAEGRLGHVANHVRALGLDLDQAKALDRDLLRHQLVDHALGGLADGLEGVLRGCRGVVDLRVDLAVDPARSRRALALEALDLLPNGADRVGCDLRGRLSRAERDLFHGVGDVSYFGAHWFAPLGDFGTWPFLDAAHYNALRQGGSSEVLQPVDKPLCGRAEHVVVGHAA